MSIDASMSEYHSVRIKTFKNPVRNSLWIYVCLLFAPVLYYQISFQWNAWFYTYVYNFFFIIVSKVIESQAVFSGVDDTVQFVLQLNKLAPIKIAFENRILDTLTVSNTPFCKFVQPSFAG